MPLKTDSEFREWSNDFTEDTPEADVTVWKDVDAVPGIVGDVESEFEGEREDVLAVGKKSLFNNAIMWLFKVAELKRTSNFYIIAFVMFLYPHFIVIVHLYIFSVNKELTHI